MAPAQTEWLFHRDERKPQTFSLAPAPSDWERAQKTDLANPKNPLSKVVGNREARKRLSRIARSALANYNHVCNDLAILFTGPKGVGKTNIAQRFAELLRLPLVEISPICLKLAHDLFIEISNALSQVKPSLTLVDLGNHNYILPPCVILIDECHELKKRHKIVTALLKAVALNDLTLYTEKGFHIKTKNVTWLMATTDRGELFDALDDRFTEIPLTLYTKREIVEIVKMNYGVGFANDGKEELSDEACSIVAHYRNRHPRKALEFAREVRLAKNDNNTWKEAADEVAKDCGIDRWGMDKRLVQILTILGKKPVAKDRLPTLIGCKEAELKKYHLPFLLCDIEGEAFITVTGEGYALTCAGKRELRKRGIMCEFQPQR